jgi:hypothetical protein
MEVILVWLPSIDLKSPAAPQLRPYLERFHRDSGPYPLAQKFMLVPSFEGITKEIRVAAKQLYNVNIRVPIQFFDTPFKAEESPEAASSAIKELRTEGEEHLRTRVLQPYAVRSNTREGEDLLETVFSQIRQASRERRGSVQFIVGPAGIGKTVLFKSLFARLYDAFLEDKARLVTSPRPLPLMPEYLRIADAATIKALVRAFLATDFARAVEARVFEWMMVNGFAIWLLDGLDELIGRDPEFFYYMLELLTLPGTSAPKIVICVRDSLFATNDELRDFCEEYGEITEVYELKKWEARSKRQFANLKLRDQADEFITLLQTHPELDELSSTPYYCDLLVQQYQSGTFGDSYSESALLRSAVSNIVNREYNKGLLDKDLVPEDEVVQFLEALAAEDMEGGFQGVEADAVKDWAQIVLPSDLGDEDLKVFLVHMSQLALFTQGPLTGNIRFAQEILEYFLLGQYLSRLLDRDAEVFLRRLAVRQIRADWITLKVVAEHVRASGKLPDLLDLTHQASCPTAFKNVVQTAALGADAPGVLRQIGFERRDLSGMLFRGLDFSGVSFRGSDLTDTQFDHCTLTDANFEEAILKNTGFLLDDDALRGAKFGDLAHFHSLRAESGRTLSEHSETQRWIDERTGVPTRIIQPCRAAQQLRYLFGKFVHPNGIARRAMLDRRAVLSGKRFQDPEKALEAAIRYGYLTEEERFRDRIKRTDGDLYSEMVEYVKALKLSPGLRILLSDVCGSEGCPHIPAPPEA